MDEEYSSTPKLCNFSRTWLSFSNNIYFAFFLKKKILIKKKGGVGSNRCHESFNDDSFNDGGDSFL